jgi:hypothetical protein
VLATIPDIPPTPKHMNKIPFLDFIYRLKTPLLRDLINRQKEISSRGCPLPAPLFDQWPRFVCVCVLFGCSHRRWIKLFTFSDPSTRAPQPTVKNNCS